MQAWVAAAVGVAAAGASAYAWHLSGAPGHLLAAAGFVMLGLAWGRLHAVAWAGALLILGGSAMRWIG